MGVINLSLFFAGASTTAARSWDRCKTARYGADDISSAISTLLFLFFTVSIQLSLQGPGVHSQNTKVALAYIKDLGGWKADVHPQCSFDVNTVVAQIISDTISNIFLILIPVSIALVASIQTRQRFRLITMFSTTLLATAVSFYHSYVLLRWSGWQEILAAILQCTVCVIVSNISVLIAWLLRRTPPASPESDEQLWLQTISWAVGSATKLFLAWVPVSSVANSNDHGGGSNSGIRGNIQSNMQLEIVQG
uniref:Uncharacterized protein n=1 Tax=Psilocybe cubensis TaxID=181762 RepID=A0A8H7XRY4_PSICU